MKFSAITIFSIAGLVAAQAPGDFYTSSSSSDAVSSTSSVVESSTSAVESSSSSSTSVSVAASSTSSAAAAGYTPDAGTPSKGTESNPGSTSSTSPSAPAFKVPSGISQECSGFLTALDKDTSIQSCISPALSALSGTSNPTWSTVCSKVSTSGCSESSYYKFLSYFSGNCTAELISTPNEAVTAIYDSLYVALPFQKAVCTKDSLGNWCASGYANATSESGAGANAAQTPLSTGAGYPDADAFTKENLLFLGYHADMSTAAMCTTCLQKVMTIYFGHESIRPYPTGLNNSPLMSVQRDLWTAAQAQCPADFVSNTVANTGAGASQVNAAPAFTPAKGAIAILALIAGVVAI